MLTVTQKLNQGLDHLADFNAVLTSAHADISQLLKEAQQNNVFNDQTRRLIVLQLRIRDFQWHMRRLVNNLEGMADDIPKAFAPPVPGIVTATCERITTMSLTINFSLPEKSDIDVAKVTFKATKSDGSTVFDGDVTANSPAKDSGEHGTLVVTGVDAQIGDVLEYSLTNTDTSNNVSEPRTGQITLISSDQTAPPIPGEVTATATPE